MDKQFARILMLSVLLPAGAALAEAMQYEHVSFGTLDQDVMSNFMDKPPAGIESEIASENKDRIKATAKDDKHSHNVASRGDGVSGNAR